MKKLKKKLRRQARLLHQIGKAMLLHMRTDVAPDAALPGMRKVARAAAELLDRNRGSLNLTPHDLETLSRVAANLKDIEER